VPQKRAARQSLFAQRWVHVFEEDTAEGAVYRPEDADLPLSRRPREVLELAPDGTAHVLVPGPDDRLQKQAARWSEEGNEVVIRSTGKTRGAKEYRIVKRSPERLVVKQ
jgi:hypothetical protein